MPFRGESTDLAGIVAYLEEQIRSLQSGQMSLVDTIFIGGGSSGGTGGGGGGGGTGGGTTTIIQEASFLSVSKWINGVG